MSENEAKLVINERVENRWRDVRGFCCCPHIVRFLSLNPNEYHAVSKENEKRVREKF